MAIPSSVLKAPIEEYLRTNGNYYYEIIMELVLYETKLIHIFFLSLKFFANLKSILFQLIFMFSSSLLLFNTILVY